MTSENDLESISDDARKLAENIRQERAYAGLSQDQVARVLGITRAAVSALETGRRRVSGVELKHLAKLFGTSADRLMGAEAPRDATADALFRTTRELSNEDREQVLRFAEFLRHAGAAPDVGKSG
ncbi:helix-turn-helix transcriptional regulator [Microbacterium sulfonylureivorans]|uniref:helix-turn-helix transcriptional regulator n=1 Tax=Microbacterium sulfonylureivorans TaxID=2486854 RepID=UPI000FDABD60|nr:helix-turn-helix transcriptional regulator [Microbacterium sulfonylureivorans]